MSTQNNQNHEFSYSLIKQMQEQLQIQLKELNENSRKLSDLVQEMRIDLTKLSHVKSDLIVLEKEVAVLQNWKTQIEQSVTIEDMKKIKQEANNWKKFQVQIVTSCFILFSILQFIAPHIFKVLNH